MKREPFVFTVGQLNRYVQGLLERDRALQDVWVKGEIADLTVHSRSGHCYFALQDSASQIRGVMWADRAAGLTFSLAEGLGVLAHGRVQVYLPRGQYQLEVMELRPEGVGAMYLAFAQLKQKLEAEGLFSPDRKRRLPPIPRRVALLTSPEGAVFHDFVSVVRRRWPALNVLLIPTPVTGANAAPGIVRAFELVGRLRGLDVVVLARGGGSPEELMAFNAETVARAIAACPVPVVSAVGHETDYTIADFVADARAPTPSAAAELLVPDRIELRRRIETLRARATVALRRRVERVRRELFLLQARPVLQSPLRLLSDRRQRVDELTEGLSHLVGETIATGRQRLQLIGGKLDALSPTAVLRRGYAVVRRLPQRALVRSAMALSAGDRAELLLVDGRAECTVESVES